MKRLTVVAVSFTAVVVIALYALPRLASGGALVEPSPAPDFPQRSQEDWLNSAPLTLADLRGKVVLIDFWTFDCWNCYRSFPWLKSVESRLEAQGLQVIGIHSPEFEHEKVRANVEEKVREFALTHPVMIDNDFAYWRAMGNRYWPAWYLIDRHGNVRAVFAGETHEGDRQAKLIEKLIRELLAEAS
jgi:glutathione peroxidase-family protein